MTLFVDGNNVPFITNNNLFYSPSLPLAYSPIAIQFVPPYRITSNDSPSVSLSVSPTRLNENTNTKFAFTFTRWLNLSITRSPRRCGWLCRFGFIFEYRLNIF